jgi:hypothetical protein
MCNYTNNTRSTYADWAETIQEATGYDCSMLTAEQMDEVGMAAERAWCDWEWAEAKLDGDEEYNARVRLARANVKACGATSENEMVGSYVGGFYDDYGI